MKNKYVTFPTHERKILGLNGLNHDATASLINGTEILFAGHNERYSDIKFDEELNQPLLSDLKRYGDWDTVVWFEDSLLKKTRQLYAGQYREVFTRKNLPHHYLKKFGIQPDYYISHHLSHASAAYFTSPYDNAISVNIDAIGEWECATIYYIETDKNKRTTFTKLWSETYPNSLGLWYSAMTQRLGLKPQEDEYILMGMAGWSTWDTESDEMYKEMSDYFFAEPTGIKMKHNLHRGCMNWDSEIYPDDGSEEWKFKIASVTQKLCEDRIMDIFDLANRLVPTCDNYVYGLSLIHI